MREFAKSFKAVPSLNPSARTATATGAAVDRLGFDGLTFAVHSGAWTDGSHVLSAEESDDNTTWTAVAAGNLTAVLPTIGAAGAANAATLVGYLGDARYVRVKATVTGTTTGAVYGATVLLGAARVKPAA